MTYVVEPDLSNLSFLEDALEDVAHVRVLEQGAQAHSLASDVERARDRARETVDHGQRRREHRGNLTTMVDFATNVSFLTGPILGYLNLRAVTGPNVPAGDRPGRALLLLSYAGLALPGGTAAIYVISVW